MLQWFTNVYNVHQLSLGFSRPSGEGSAWIRLYTSVLPDVFNDLHINMHENWNLEVLKLIIKKKIKIMA